MSSHLRHRIWSRWDPANQLLPPFRTPWPSPTHPQTSRHVFLHTRPGLPFRAALRIPTNRTFSSCGAPIYRVNSSNGAASISTTSIAASHATSVGKTLYTGLPVSRQSNPFLAQQVWRRGIYSGGRRRERGSGRRNKSSASSSRKGQKPVEDDKHASPVPPPPDKVEPHLPDSSPPGKYLNLPQMPKMPQMPHRPTKEELLQAATGFWSRLKVRFKWFSIRSVRPWNVDDWSAFVSWFVLGNIVWILVGTTTFFSLVILSINTVVAQGMLIIL
jgi:distribution and morphology protein 31